MTTEDRIAFGDGRSMFLCSVTLLAFLRRISDVIGDANKRRRTEKEGRKQKQEVRYVIWVRFYIQHTTTNDL